MERLIKYQFLSDTSEIDFEEIQKIINYLSQTKTKEAILNEAIRLSFFFFIFL